MSEAFDEYCRLFHQDIFIEYGSLEDAIEANVASLKPCSLKVLKIYLETTVVNENISAKTLLRKAIRDIYFSNTKSAQYFLTQTLKTIENRLDQLREEKIKHYSRE